MTRHYMLRSFDHAGYYETRSLLALLALGIALYFWTKRRDARYLVMFVSGVVFQAFLEWYLQSGGARGAGSTRRCSQERCSSADGRMERRALFHQERRRAVQHQPLRLREHRLPR